MKRHTQRIVAVGALALAGGAFCVDRFVFGYTEPQGAAAAATPSSGRAEAPKAPAAPATAVADATPEASVSRRLAGLKDRMPPGCVAEERDALTIPASWHIEPPPEEKKPEAAPVVVAKPEFPKFVLTTVIGGADSAVAVVDGKAVRVGDQIQGYTVESIKSVTRKGDTTPANVVLEGPAGKLTLETSRPDDEPAPEVPRPEPARPGPKKK